MDDEVHAKPRPGELAIKLARLNGVLVTPRDAVNDRMLTYLCPLCDNKVVLRKGLIRRPHFAHKARNTTQDGLDNQECLVVQMARLHQRESLDHKLAKLRIEKASCLLLGKACKFCQARSEPQSFRIVEACTEKCVLVEDKKYFVDVFLQVVQESSVPTPLVVEVFQTHAIHEKFDALTHHGLMVYELCAKQILESKDVSDLLVDTTTWECQACQQKRLDSAKQEEEHLLRLQAEHQAQRMKQQAEQQAEQAKIQANPQPKQEHSRDASRSVYYYDPFGDDCDHVESKRVLLKSIKAEIASSTTQIMNEWQARLQVCKVNKQTPWPYLDATMNMRLDIPFDEKDYTKRWYNSGKYRVVFEDQAWWPYDTEERQTETHLSRPEDVEAWSEYSFMQRVYFTPDKYSFKQAKQAGMLSHKVGQVWHNYFRGVNAAELAFKYGKQCCRVNLCVPFSQKDEAKALQQVYWDSNLRTWYSCCCMTWVCKRYAYGFPNV